MPESTLFDLLVAQTWQIAVVAIAVWIVTRFFAGNRPHLAHALWMLVLLKAIVPPVISSPTSLFSWIESPAVTASAMGENSDTESPISEEITSADSPFATMPVPILGVPTNPSEAAVASDPSGQSNWFESFSFPAMDSRSWLTLAAYLWLASAVFGVTLMLFKYGFLIRRLRRTKAVTPPEIEALTRRLASQLGLRRRVRVRVMDHHLGPVVLGLFCPTVVLPAIIVRNMNHRELELLLAHELIHLRRGDLWWTLVQQFSRILFWFHPLVHFAGRHATQEAERSCDEETVTSLGCSPAAYAHCLLKVLEQKHRLHSVPALPGVRPVEITSARLERVMSLRHGSHRRSPVWTWMVLVLGGMVTLPGAALIWAQDHTHTSQPANTKTENPETTGQTRIASNTHVKQSDSGRTFTNDPIKTESAPDPRSQAVTIKSTLYSLTAKDVEALGLDWSTYMAWEPSQSNSIRKLEDSSKVITVVSNCPSQYAELNSSQHRNLLKQIESGPGSQMLQTSQVSIANEVTAQLASSVKSPYRIGMREIPGQPDVPSQPIIRSFSAGLDHHVKSTSLDSGKLHLETWFMFSSIDNLSKISLPNADSDVDANPEKPRLTCRKVYSIIDIAPENKLAILFSDQNKLPHIAILETTLAMDKATPDLDGTAKSDSTNGTKSIPKTSTTAIQPAKLRFVLSGESDDPLNVEGCRTAEYAGETIAVTDAIKIIDDGNRVTLKGENLRFSHDGVVSLSADQGELQIPKEGNGLSIKLDGKAMMWQSDSVLVRADHISYSFHPEYQVCEYKGSVRIANAKPFYDDNTPTMPEVTADHVWMEKEMVVHYAGNVRISHNPPHGDSWVVEGEEIQFSAGGKSMRGITADDYKIIKPKN